MRMSHRSNSAGVVTSRSSLAMTSKVWLAGASFWCPSTWLPSSVTLQSRVRYLPVNGMTHE